MKTLLFALLLSSTAFAQTSKTPIEISCSSKPGDSVGSEVCTAIRDIVAASPRYREVDQNSDGYQIKLITVAIEENVNTAVSMVTLWNNMYLTNVVQTCGVNAVSRCAHSMVSSFDEDVTSLDKASAEILAKRVRK